MVNIQNYKDVFNFVVLYIDFLGESNLVKNSCLLVSHSFEHAAFYIDMLRISSYRTGNI
jgi:hypothetical protein